MSFLRLFKGLGMPLAIKIYFYKVVRHFSKGARRGYHYNIYSAFFYVEKERGQLVKCENGYKVSFRFEGVPVSILLRRDSSDSAVFRQVFLDREYFPAISLVRSFPNLEIRTVIDAGANIGLTAVQFSTFFPSAKIWAIEADSMNYVSLERNIVLSSRQTITPIYRALWNSNEPLFIENVNRDKLEWSRSVTPTEVASQNSVQGIAFDEVISLAGGSIDLFKIDIEGAESSFFADRARSIQLLRRVKFLVIELHDDTEFNLQFRHILQAAGFCFTTVNESLVALNLKALSSLKSD